MPENKKMTEENSFFADEITCPYCKYVMECEDACDFISYHGSENGRQNAECGNCLNLFLIEEFVSRSYETTKVKFYYIVEYFSKKNDKIVKWRADCDNTEEYCMRQLEQIKTLQKVGFAEDIVDPVVVRINVPEIEDYK